MGGLSVLNLATNNLGVPVLPQGWSEDWKADGSARKYTHTDGSNQDQHPGNPEGIIALANAIPSMRALTSLDISNNELGAHGFKHLLEPLKGSKGLTELNVASNDAVNTMDGTGNTNTSGVVALANVIGNMEALTHLDVSDNKIGTLPSNWEEGTNEGDGKKIYKPPGGEWQWDPPKPEGAIALANAIKNMGGISTVIVNTFPLPIQDIKSKAELDFSGKELKAEDAIIIAVLIPSNVSHKPYLPLLSLMSLSVTRGR
jgi:Leucine-rich repeat (LRR) protein